MDRQERVPLWYHEGYTLDHVSAELRKSGHDIEEVARRVVQYADWLRKQELHNQDVRARPTA